MELNPDIKKYRTKNDKLYYFNTFNPIDHVCIDFIFRESMIIFNVFESERIALPSFLKISNGEVLEIAYVNRKQVGVHSAES